MSVLQLTSGRLAAVTALFGRAAELARLRCWFGRSGRGPAASGRVLGRGGIGKTRLLEGPRRRRNPWGAGSGRGRWRRASTPPYWLWEQLFGLDAVASLPLRSSGWLRSEKGGAPVPSVAQSETTDPRSAESASLKLLFQKPADEPVMASPR